MRYFLISVFSILFCTVGCKINNEPRVRSTYYNWDAHNLRVRVFNEQAIVYEVFILSGTKFELLDHTKTNTPFFVALGDSMIVEFENGKKLIYTKFLTPTQNNPLHLDGYNYFKATDIYNFQYAFTDEHYSKAQ